MYFLPLEALGCRRGLHKLYKKNIKTKNSRNHLFEASQGGRSQLNRQFKVLGSQSCLRKQATRQRSQMCHEASISTARLSKADEVRRVSCGCWMGRGPPPTDKCLRTSPPAVYGVREGKLFVGPAPPISKCFWCLEKVWTARNLCLSFQKAFFLLLFETANWKLLGAAALFLTRCN